MTGQKNMPRETSTVLAARGMFFTEAT